MLNIEQGIVNFKEWGSTALRIEQYLCSRAVATAYYSDLPVKSLVSRPNF